MSFVGRIRVVSGLRACLFVAALSAACLSQAQLNVGSDGSDGAFNNGNQTWINLAEAFTSTWDTPSVNAGKGVYDPFRWAVVYKYSSFNLTGGWIQFQPHPSGAPVVFLVQGDATINGTIYLNGAGQNGNTLSLPGPGGFRGGAGPSGAIAGSAGFGPGGADYISGDVYGYGGSYGTKGSGSSGPTYSNVTCIPLVGGSGGSGGAGNANGGGAGGGGILIACGGTLTVNGWIYANGGSSDYGGGASGGTIRLVGNRVVVQGLLQATGGSSRQPGGDGRIRIESNTRSLTGTFQPIASVTTSVPATPQIWPKNVDPSVAIASIGSTTAPADPNGNLFDPDVPLTSGGNKSVNVLAHNVPTDGSWTVQVRLTPRNGAASFQNCTLLSGNQATSTWTCVLNFDGGPGAVIARAYKNQQ